MQSFTFRIFGDPLKRNPEAWALSVRFLHLLSDIASLVSVSTSAVLLMLFMSNEFAGAMN